MVTVNALTDRRRRRVQFVLPGQTVEKLDILRTQLGASSRAEVLRIAVELLTWAAMHRSRGEDIAALRQDGVVETIAIPVGAPGPAPG